MMRKLHYLSTPQSNMRTCTCFNEVIRVHQTLSFEKQEYWTTEQVVESANCPNFPASTKEGTINYSQQYMKNTQAVS